jgi:hypothetical protein
MSEKVNISQAPWQECECGGLTFTTHSMVKRLSALISPDGKEHMIPVEVYLCDKCGKIPGFISKEIPGLPKELKSKLETDPGWAGPK